MSDINFQPIFNYIDNSIRPLNEQFGEFRHELSDVKVQVANLAHELSEMRQELHVSNHRLDRIESWVPKVGDKTGIPFEF
jgi:hypothetical protein